MKQLPALLLTAVILFVNAASAQPELWQFKIDPALKTATSGAQQAEMLVVLKEQADLSLAKTFRRKIDKNRFVVETLKAVAYATQPEVEDVLLQFQAPHRAYWIINAFWAKGDRGLAEALAQLPAVARVEYNPIWKLQRPLEEPEEVVVERMLTPRSWGLTKINANAVWDLGFKGASIVVGGQDTGYEWQHPALKNKYRGWNGASYDHNYNWHDAIHDPIGAGSNSCGLNLKKPCDDDGHGTHTMGTMVGGPNVDSIYGVAPDAKWVGCRNMEEGDGTPATYIECFEWFVEPTDTNGLNEDVSKSPHVINNSWGCPGSEGCNPGNFATMNAVVNTVRAAGILVVVSAGNSGSACSTVDSPAAIYAGSFTVGSTTSTDGISSFSSRGPVTVDGSNRKKPDISAPGSGISSAYGYDNLSGSHTYLSLSGTSMAGPHIAGTAALIMSAQPSLIGDVDSLELIMENSALELFDTSPFCGDDNASSSPNNVFGHGRVNALAAINLALNLPVEFVRFKGERRGSDAYLTWETASEKDCRTFEVWHSADGRTWEVLGQTPCANSETGAYYNWSHKTPASGIQYYRLKQIDFSGDFDFSNMVSLAFSDSGLDFRVTPQPSIGSAWVELAGVQPGSRYNLTVFALDGRALLNFVMRESAVVALQALPTGMYAAVLREGAGKVLGMKRFSWAP